MGIDRVIDRFDRGREAARRGASDTLAFVLTQKHALVAIRGGPKLIADAEDMFKRLERGGEISPAAYTYIDDIYEKTMKALGLPSVNKHIDKKPRGLRYG